MTSWQPNRFEFNSTVYLQYINWISIAIGIGIGIGIGIFPLMFSLFFFLWLGRKICDERQHLGGRQGYTTRLLSQKRWGQLKWAQRSLARRGWRHRCASCARSGRFTTWAPVRIIGSLSLLVGCLIFLLSISISISEEKRTRAAEPSRRFPSRWNLSVAFFFIWKWRDFSLVFKSNVTRFFPECNKPLNDGRTKN